MVVKYMYEEFGNDKIKLILEELAKYPQRTEGFEYERHEKLHREQLYTALKRVLGVNMDEFNSRWMEWISKQS